MGVGEAEGKTMRRRAISGTRTTRISPPTESAWRAKSHSQDLDPWPDGGAASTIREILAPITNRRWPHSGVRERKAAQAMSRCGRPPNLPCPILR